MGEWECQREDFWKAYLNIKFLSQCGVKAMGNHREGRRSSTILQRWTDLLNSVAPTAEPKLNVKQKTETGSQTERTDLWLPRGMRVGEGRRGTLGLADANYSVENG